MKVSELKAVLEAHPESRMFWMLPDRSFVPEHCHITEVGRVQKDFVDCGGTVRSHASCLLQIWFAHDLHHRLHTTTLAKIIGLAGSVLREEDLPVEVEYECGNVAQYQLTDFEATPAGLLFHLGSKHTSCLAPDKCGVGGSCC